MKSENHYKNSSFREKLIEHLFIGELLKLAWQNGDSLEIAKPEVDNQGYDIIADINGVIRHIQLKSTKAGGKAARQNVHLGLSRKPAGAVVWIFFNERTLQLGPFLYFGNEGVGPMKDIHGYKVATHTKGNSQGFKKERPEIRVLTKGAFVKYDSILDLYTKLSTKRS